MRTVSLLLLACTAVVLFQWTLDVADACGICLIPSARARSAAIDDLREVHTQFAGNFAAIMADVSQGRISLAEASKQTVSAATALNPAFLIHIDANESKGDIQVKVAHRLLIQLDPMTPVVGSPAMDRALYHTLEEEYGRMAVTWKPAL